jgi:carboxyl-terminal processing protease
VPLKIEAPLARVGWRYPARPLRGLILDLRGNGGGDPAEVTRLLGAFTHGAAYTYDCDVRGRCAARYTGKDVPLLHLPLVVLTDRNCVSACDAFSGAVKDLRLGTLVGARTGASSPAPRTVTCSTTAACLAFRQSTS